MGGAVSTNLRLDRFTRYYPQRKSGLERQGRFPSAKLTLGKYSSIFDSLVLGDVKIGEHSTIFNSQIMPKVSIGNNVLIDPYGIGAGIIFEEGAIIEDNNIIPGIPGHLLRFKAGIIVPSGTFGDTSTSMLLKLQNPKLRFGLSESPIDGILHYISALNNNGMRHSIDVFKDVKIDQLFMLQRLSLVNLSEGEQVYEIPVLIPHIF